MNSKYLGIAALVFACAVAQADNIKWDSGGGADTAFETAANWNTDTVPGTNDNFYIDNGGTAVFSASSGNIEVKRALVGEASSSSGTLNITGGELKLATSSQSLETRIGRRGTAVVNQSGGLWRVGHKLQLGGNGGNGTINLTGGELEIYRRGDSISGVADVSLDLYDGLVGISGGDLETRAGVEVSAAGTFSVQGSDSAFIKIGSYSDEDGFWLQRAGSTLRGGIDLGGVTKIFIDDIEGTNGTYAVFESGALLDVDYYNGGYGGGTWVVMEVENGDIIDNGLAFAPGVGTNWTFNVDNSGANGKLTVSSSGEPAPPQVDVTLNVGDSRKQMLRLGLDYERLWSWNQRARSRIDDLAQWSVKDCNIDYIRCAMNSDYELVETNFNPSAYTDKIIPMMQTMQLANPNIKWFASPRPLDQAVSGASWQPYPLWVTGASSYTSGDYDFQDIKCAEYIVHYLLLMKSYGFKITYLDLSNEWQSNVSGGRMTQSDARDISEYLHETYLANPWEHPELPGLVLTADDIPLFVGPSSWNYSQGKSWINNLNTQAKKDAIDIASSHNTDRTGTALDFADAVDTYCNPGTEVWETEQHGWKSTSGENEVTSFSYYMESIRAGFSGINSWLAIGTASQGHSFLLNENGDITRNVKYYIFQKLANTSNYGYSLDINEPSELNNTMALTRENLLTVWVNNTEAAEQTIEVDIGNRTMEGTEVQYTRWNEGLPVEGVGDATFYTTSTSFVATVEGESLYCFEVPLMGADDNYPLVQAETYDAGSGVAIQGGGVAFASVGSEVSYDLDITQTCNHDVAFRVSSASANIAFEIYDGTNLLAAIDRPATGGAQQWTTLYQTLPLDGGPMELRIVATGGGWNLDWIGFNPTFYDFDLANAALGQAYSASTEISGYEADKAFDLTYEKKLNGNTGTRWASSASPAWLEVDFGTPTAIQGVRLYDYGNRTQSYEVQYYDGTWKTAYIGGDPVNGYIYLFPTVVGSKFRYQSVTSSGNPSIWELALYADPNYNGTNPAPEVALSVDTASLTLSWSGMEGTTYALQQSTNLVEGFTTIESGIPVLDATNTNVIATPDDQGFYRVIVE